MTRRLILCAAAAAAFIPGAAAQAAVVSYSVDGDGDESGFVESRVLTVAASGPELNDMTITTGRDGFVVRDSTAQLEAKAPCRSVDPHTVRCELNLLGGPVPKQREGLTAGALVDLGEGDDRLTYQSSLGSGEESTTIKGGSGNDTLTAVAGNVTMLGGEGADTLHGTAQPDILTGGPGPDTLEGGGGDDFLSGDDDYPAAGIVPAPFPDVINGGPGSDKAAYMNHQVPVTVDLADPGPDGAVGEQDLLSSIENVDGGTRDDVLRGDGNANRLDGGQGNDTLSGGAGNDQLTGESIAAGPGRDLISGILGTALSCGAGTDRIAALSLKLARRPAPADCELVDFGGTASAHPRLSRGRVTFTLKSQRAFKGTLRVYDGRTLLGSKSVRVPANRKSLAVSVKIRAASHRRTLRAKLTRPAIAPPPLVDTWLFVPRR